jgi:hypothetical protein
MRGLPTLTHSPASISARKGFSMRSFFLIAMAAMMLPGCVSVPSQCSHLSDRDYHHGSDHLRAVCARAEIDEDYQDTMLWLLGAEMLLGVMSQP